jgi:hypothetical protein
LYDFYGIILFVERITQAKMGIHALKEFNGLGGVAWVEEWGVNRLSSTLL